MVQETSVCVPLWVHGLRIFTIFQSQFKITTTFLDSPTMPPQQETQLKLITERALYCSSTYTLTFWRFGNENEKLKLYMKESWEITWQISQLGVVEEEEERGTRWCLLASLLAVWILWSHEQQSAASSAQQTTVASAVSQALHCICIFIFLSTHKIQNSF